jgi:hypothetical protein
MMAKIKIPALTKNRTPILNLQTSLIQSDSFTETVKGNGKVVPVLN